MVFKLRHIPIIFVVAAIAVAVWAYTTYDTLMVNDRTTTETSIKDPEHIAIQDIPEVEFSETSDENSSLTPPASSLPNIPEPEDRTSGSSLSEKAKTDLGITEPIVEEQVFYATATPDDTIYPQWYTTAISAPAAWDVSTGSNSTLIAVIDTGYALDHEDLNAAWFINGGEQGTTTATDSCWTGSPQDKQTNECDDDGNGYSDDWRGWDFSNNDNYPQAGDNSVSGATHGTKSSGLVGARGNNSTGVASINWQTQILPIQALFDEGYGYSTDITNAVYYAVEMGADVINMSLGGPYPDSFTRAAIQYAQQNNVIVVASSGNCGINQTDPECIGFPSPGGMGYPARYPETIAVGAITSSDSRASFSSYGPELDIVAPGSGTIRTPSWSSSNETSLYATSSYGTSFSAPIVAGAVGILRAEYPDITKDEVVALMSNSSDKVAGMGSSDWTESYGWGRLNVSTLLDELATYQQQLLKGSGRISSQSNTTTPLLSTNTGHTSASAITGSTTVRTYCVTTPATICQLTLDKVGSATNVVLPSVRSNNQGIAIIEWSKSVASTGSWDATVTANSNTSASERLIIQ